MTEREKYEFIYSDCLTYGRSNHGQGTEHLCFMFDSLLDVGGAFTEYASDVRERYGLKVCATDITEMPRELQEGRGVEFHCVSAAEMNILAGPWLSLDKSHLRPFFDVVTAFDVLEHIPKDDLDKSLENIFAHCGRLAIFSVGTQIASWKEHILHHTVQPHAWWGEKFKQFGTHTTLKQTAQINIANGTVPMPTTYHLVRV